MLRCCLLALLSALVVVGFAALLMRLWALQVLSGSHYAATAQANQVRTVSVQAPRGLILDKNGKDWSAMVVITSRMCDGAAIVRTAIRLSAPSFRMVSAI